MQRGIEVVICTYNGASRLPATLTALAAQTLAPGGWSVLVVDNASSDGTADMVRSRWTRSDVCLRIVTETNPGQMRARERALAEADWEIICFCDDDNWLSPDYLKIALTILQAQPRTGVLGGQGIAVSSIPLPPWFGDAAGGYAVGPQGEAEGEVAASRGFVYGAGMMLRRSAWNQLTASGFKSRLSGRAGGKLHSGDDNELCLGLSLLGWQIRYTPRLIFHHEISPHRLDESYCRALYFSFGEANQTLATYRDFQRQGARPFAWKFCALTRLIHGLGLSIAANWHAPGKKPLNRDELQREYSAGRTMAFWDALRSGRFISQYKETAGWLSRRPKEANDLKQKNTGALRRVATSLGWLLADRGLRLAGGFLVGLWLARYLGPADFGLLSVATAATFFGVVATQLGLDGLVQREFVRQPDGVGRILGTVTGLSLAVSLLAWGVTAVIAFTMVQDESMRRLILWLALLVVPQALAGWEYLLQARSDLRPLVVGQNVCFVLCLGLRALLITRQAPVIAFAIVAVFERLASALAVAIWSAQRHPAGRLNFDRQLAREIMVEAWPVWAAALLTTLYLKLDQILVMHWIGEAAAGTYAAAMRLSELWWSISMIIATAVLPDLVRAARRSDREYWSHIQHYLDASAALSVLTAGTMTFLAPTIVRLFYGVRYADAANILIIQFWSAVFIYLSVARGRHLIVSGRRLVELWFALGGVALNLTANALFIPRFGAIGAAWAGLITQAGVCLVLPWLFTDTRPIVRRQFAALLFPLRVPSLWRAIRFRTAGYAPRDASSNSLLPAPPAFEKP